MSSIHANIVMDSDNNSEYNLLLDNWNLWGHLPHDSDWSVNSYINLGNIQSVEQTIALCEILPDKLIKNSMLFVGQGKTFQIWEPSNYEKFKVTAKKKSNIYRGSLKWEKQFNN